MNLKIDLGIKKIFYAINKKITKKKIIIDVTGIRLTPGNFGKDCLGNGTHKDWKGNNIECCCDECCYMMCCLESNNTDKCITCTDKQCPHSSK